MKKLIIALFVCLLLIPVQGLAFGPAIQAVIGSGAAPTCEVLASPKQTSDNANAIFGDGNAYYLETKFVADANRTIRTLIVILSDIGTGQLGTIVGALCADTAGDPSGCQNADTALPAGDKPYAYYYFRWSAGYSLTNTNTYHIRLYTSGEDGENYYRWRYNDTVTGKAMRYSSNGADWADYDSSAQGWFELSECVTFTH